MHPRLSRTVQGLLVIMAAGLSVTACGSGPSSNAAAQTTQVSTTTPSSTTIAPSTTTATSTAHHTPVHHGTTTAHSTTLDNAGVEDPQVYVQPIDMTAPEQWPKELQLNNHDSIDGITWSGWNGDTAEGDGTAHINDCACAAGQSHAIAAHIVLSTIQTVGSQDEYTTFTLTWPGQSAQDAQSWANQPI